MRARPLPSDAAPDQIDAAWDAPTMPPPLVPPPPSGSIAYKLRRPDGALVAIHGRVQNADGSKRMFWGLPDGTMGLGGVPLVDLPLYGAEHAAGWDAELPVLVTEGEKAAQALIDAGHQSVGTVTGAASTPGPVALSLLAGRRVVLWPDNDKVGAEHMSRVAARLREVAASVHTLSWEAAPEHGDAADYLAAEMVDVTIDELITAAQRPPEILKPGATGMDAADLLALDLAPLRWVVPGLLPEGTTILAAPPKVGKSCLIYQVAVEASIGGELFDRRVEPGSVLYMALEDGQRRGQDRLRTALAGRTMPRGRLEVRWSAPNIGAGLEEELVDWLDGHDDAILVAIDTLQKVRPRSDGRRNAYEVDVADLGRLQSIFRDRPVALVIVHHSSKAGSDDFLASVSGTYGITGSADTTMVIRRKRAEAFGSIEITGRDVADHRQSVRFDDKLWHSAPPALASASFERVEVYQAILHSGPMFAKVLGERLGMSRQAVQNKIADLDREGVIVRTPKGWAAAAPQDEEQPRAPAHARAGIPHSPHVSRDGDIDTRDTDHTRAPARTHARDDVAERYQASFDDGDAWS